jgi:hypothetical protein
MPPNQTGEAMPTHPYTKPYVSIAERRAIKASNSDVPLPDYTKEPRPIRIVWDANNEITHYEINRLHKLFKNKHLEGLERAQPSTALMNTKEVLTEFLAYRNIPIKLLASKIPKHLQPVVENCMINLVGVVYWKLPNKCYQMKTNYLSTISSSISITTQSKVY